MLYSFFLRFVSTSYGEYLIYPRGELLKSDYHRVSVYANGRIEQSRVVVVSVSQQIASDDQLARLLQIGIVLEEVVEARAHHHYQSLDAELDEEIEELLASAAEESAEHRERLEGLIEGLGVDSVPFDEIESLVDARYGRTRPDDFDGVLYDQLCNEETAYKFYDDLIGAIEASDAEFSIDRAALLDTLYTIREEEADGVGEVTDIMERR